MREKGIKHDDKLAQIRDQTLFLVQKLAAAKKRIAEEVVEELR